MLYVILQDSIFCKSSFSISKISDKARRYSATSLSRLWILDPLILLFLNPFTDYLAVVAVLPKGKMNLR